MEVGYFIFKKKNFDVHGVGLKPDSKNNLYYELNLNKDKKSKILNILNYKKLENYVKQIKPQIIIHLAAESLVLRSIMTQITPIKQIYLEHLIF